MAKVVINAKQIYGEGHVLEVMLVETYKEMEKIKEKSMRKETRTIFVSGFHKEATENTIYIHFQKKKNGGGEVEKVELKGEGKALVTFQDPEGTLDYSAYIPH